MEQTCPDFKKPDQSGHGLCAECVSLYVTALDRGSVPSAAASVCLTGFNLLQPGLPGTETVVPVRPSAALSLLLRPLEQEIAERQQSARTLQSALQPLEAVYEAAEPRGSGVTFLEGLSAINSAIDQATEECFSELLTAQPGGGRSHAVLASALERSQALLDKGVRMQTLYQHTMRYDTATTAYAERVTASGLAEFRTTPQLFERLLIFDRSLAFIPARADRQVALEIRVRPIVDFLIGVFESAWQAAIPLTSDGSQTGRGIIPDVQRTIAKMLVAGSLDEAIARRLGMSVRTCRAHVAKISEHLGSTNRSQLGYLIATTGFLDAPAET